MVNRITKLRRAFGTKEDPISQTELARKLRVSQSVVSRMETGERAIEGPIVFAIEALEREARQSEAA